MRRPRWAGCRTAWPPRTPHQTSQAVNPASRVLYVDIDPLVLAHALTDTLGMLVQAARQHADTASSPGAPTVPVPPADFPGRLLLAMLRPGWRVAMT